MKQDPVQDLFKILFRYFSEWRIQDRIKIYSRSYQGSSEDYKRGFCQDFIRVSSGAGSNLLIMILSGMIGISDQDLGKKMTRSLKRIVQEQELRPLKKNKSMIRILIRKYKDPVRILSGLCLETIKHLTFQDPVRNLPSMDRTIC